MSAADLLSRVHEYGVELNSSGDLLRFRPKGALPPAVVEELRQHKRMLLALLAADDPAVAERVAAMRARHPPSPGPIPFLTARDVPRDAPGCRSCGETLALLADGLAARCQPCAFAAHLVITGYQKATEAAIISGFPGVAGVIHDQ